MVWRWIYERGGQNKFEKIKIFSHSNFIKLAEDNVSSRNFNAHHAFPLCISLLIWSGGLNGWGEEDEAYWISVNELFANFSQFLMSSALARALHSLSIIELEEIWDSKFLIIWGDFSKLLNCYNSTLNSGIYDNSAAAAQFERHQLISHVLWHVLHSWAELSGQRLFTHTTRMKQIFSLTNRPQLIQLLNFVP